MHGLGWLPGWWLVGSSMSDDDLRDAKRKYWSQRSGAARRGIGFDLTFEQWLMIWGDRLKDRGRAANQLGMCRTKDQGPYAVGNVRLDTPKGNAAECGMLYRARKHAEIRPNHAWQNKASCPGAGAEWLTRNVFAPYVEDEDY